MAIVRVNARFAVQRLWLLLVCACACAFAGSALALVEPSRDVGADNARLIPLLSLERNWTFQAGDRPEWAQPDYDDSGWGRMALPARWPKGGYPGTGQLAWYRLVLPVLPPSPGGGSGQLAVRMGKIMHAYELYAGGQLLGGVGRLPPAASSQYDRVRVYSVPDSAIAPDGTLVLALRVWGGPELAVNAWGTGPYDGSFELGQYRDLLMGTVLDETPGMLASVFFLGFGWYHLYLYGRNRQLKTYLWFGLLAINLGIYGLLLSQWKYVLDWQFITFKKLEFGTIYLFPALGLQMIWSLLRQPQGPLLRLYQLLFVLAALVVVAIPGPEIHYRSLVAWQLLTIPVLILAPLLVVRKALAGNREARTVLVGVIIFVATCINDLLIDWVPLQTPRLVHFGFVAIMLSMAVSLANRFTSMLNKLEQEVAERTDELQTANAHLATAARIDPLTGLLNRRGFTEEAAAEIQRGLRSGRSFAVVLADVDKFKQFNDRFGHACGDDVLRQVAQLLGQRTRDIDCVARWGGEEFILMLPESELEGAGVLAEALRGCIEDCEFEFEEQPLKITMTFGIAVYRKGETLEGCIDRADTALYEGKERGRNKVMLGNYQGLSLVT